MSSNYHHTHSACNIQNVCIEKQLFAQRVGFTDMRWSHALDYHVYHDIWKAVVGQAVFASRKWVIITTNMPSQ